MSGLTRSAGLMLLVLATAASAQSAQDQLKKARALADKNKFAPALKLVDKAMVEPGNDLETTLALLELTGVCNAGLKKIPAAKLAFSKLLALAPSYTLGRRGPAIVVKTFQEVQGTAAPLIIQPTTPDMNGGKIGEVAVEVREDPLKLAKTVLFNYRVSGGKWKTRAVPAVSGRVAARVDAPDKVEWYATVLGPNDAEVMRIRNIDSPITHTYSPPAPREPDPPKSMTMEPPPMPDSPRREEPARKEVAKSRLAPEIRTPDPEPEPDEKPRKRRLAGWVTPVGLVLVGLGAGAAGTGTYFGLQAKDARSRFDSAVAAGGVVAALSRREAMNLDSQVQLDGMLANSLWIAGGALVLTAIIVWIAGPTEVVAR